MQKLRSIGPALFLAPWAVVPIIAVSGLGTSDADLSSDFGWGLFFGLIGGLPFAYLGMLVVGLPSFLLLRRINRANALSLGLVVFAVPVALTWDPNRSGMAITAGACGLAVALAAWFMLPAASRNVGSRPARSNEA